MQNAQRAKQLKEVEFEKAAVKDDGQWEVPQEVRDAWGLVSGSSAQSVVHESSYLPFIFPSLTDSSAQPENPLMTQRPKGRRTFDKKGREVTQDTVEPEPTSNASPQKEEKNASSESGSKKSRIHPRPISISDSSGKLLSGFPSKHTKTAKQVIYDNSGVGTDLRPPKPTYPVKSMPNVFLKPSGVDDPGDTKPYEEASNSNAPSDADFSSRTRSKRRQNKEHRDEEGTKRKKKKRSVS